MAPLRPLATRGEDDLLVADTEPSDGNVGAEANVTVGEILRRAKVCYETEDLSGALCLADKAVALDPGNPDAWNARGVFLRTMGHSAASIACYRRAIDLDSQGAGAWSNLGNSLKDLKQFNSAVACHRRAVELRPDNPLAFHNLGIACVAAGQHREAIGAFNRALLLKPGDPQTRWDRGLSHLHLGDLAAGWVDYEARIETGSLPSRDLPGRPWHLQRYPGQRLLVTAEQGFGDAIWAARFLARTKALGGELVMECQRALIPLFTALGVVDRFVVKGQGLPDADWHIPICSLPGRFISDFGAIDGRPYLHAARHLPKRLSAQLEASKGKLRVGIVWSGSTTFKANGERALTLDRFRHAFSLPGIQLFSLQKGQPAGELGRNGSDDEIIDLAPALRDFADTAAAIAAMDLIIMTDSAVAHLGGALGKPVWLLLGHMPYWLWLEERKDSPWYSSLRLYRQRAAGDWSSPLDEAGSDLLALSISAPLIRERLRKRVLPLSHEIS